jgi:FKBP-type peptidyl-prolyl cis-trans isomerase FklB
MKIKLMALMLSLTVPSAYAADATSLTTENDKLSYTIGVDMGKNFKKQNINVNPAVFVKGMQDVMSNGKLQLSDEQMKATLQKFQQQLISKKIAQFKVQADANKKKGDAFLTANKGKKGVVTLASGLQYKVLEKGQGAKPAKDDSVTVEYTGKLINGKVFDSSERTGKPATFKVSQVIPGWTEALQLMSPGSTWEIYVPSKLAYGQRGVGGPIGPNETLIFKIKLIKIDKKAGA